MPSWLRFDLHRTLSRRYLARRWSRTLLIIFSIALGVATLVATRTISNNLLTTGGEAVNPFAGRADFILFSGQTGMSAGMVDEIRAAHIPGLKHADALVLGRVTIPELANRSVLVLGIDMRGESTTQAHEEDGLRIEVTATEADKLAILLQRQGIALAGAALADEVKQTATAPVFHVEIAGQSTAVRLMGRIHVEKDSAAAQIADSFLILDLPVASRVLNPEWPEYVTQITVELEKGADARAARQSLQEKVGQRAVVKTVAENNEEIRDLTAGLELGLDIGGAGALVIGLFLVYNVMAVTVVERRHDIGILRSVGATRPQIVGLFVGEAVVLGSLGALLGIPLGYLMARIAIGPIREMVGQLAGPMGQRSLTLSPLLVCFAFGAGLLAAVVAGLAPALSAAREEPADAVRRIPLVRGLRRRILQILAIGLCLLLCLLATRYRDMLPRRAGAFTGSICLMLAGLVTTPLLATLVGRLFQPVFRRLLGLEGRLAADNLVRSASRIGLVIAALTATTALLVQTAGFVVSSEHAILGWIDHKVSADLFVTGGAGIDQSGTQVPMSETVAEEIKKACLEVEAVVGGRIHPLHFRDRIILLIAVDTEDFERVDPGFMSGKLSKLRLGGRAPGRPPPVIVSENFAALYGFKPPAESSDAPRERFTIRNREGEVELELIDTVEDYLWNRGVVIVDRAWYRETFKDGKIDIYDVFLKKGANREAIRERLEAWGQSQTQKPVLFVATRDKVRDEISSGLRKLYSLAYAQQILIGMVALLGVISALFISVLQRTREFGLLRAVGASQAQILRCVLAEAALMGLIGALLGLALGFLLEWYVLDVLLLDEAGFLFPLRFPWVGAGVVAVVAVLSATLVGLLPAWHATRLRIPEAIAYE